eukprot:15045443-Alexandrium_andersonii.AAC.1
MSHAGAFRPRRAQRDVLDRLGPVTLAKLRRLLEKHRREAEQRVRKKQKKPKPHIWAEQGQSYFAEARSIMESA